ncbi:M1 family aminopeptidase [Actinoplanes sp. NPDC049265]|uniref:M1 family aminopeptidase n=1 Tax=Actinoplanes sp. NPDC049265 TaxID=3363902 RepID=UPI00371081D1
MLRSAALALTALMAVVIGSAPAGAAGGGQDPPHPGSAGIGDPYFPLDGNGGYDVRHYGLDLRYTPATDILAGAATIEARATEHLSAFNLDLRGMTVRSVMVNDRAATWTRAGGELTVTPREALRAGHWFTIRVVYDGVPGTIDDPGIGTNGAFPTDDGVLIAGQPHGAALWYPVNDHPADKAAYTFRVGVPEGLTAVANGEPVGRSTRDGWTTWQWDAAEPMASYLSTLAVGKFDLKSYRAKGLNYLDAVDPVLARREAPRSGERMAISRPGNSAYKRLTRTIDVPAGGATAGFWVDRSTEKDFDFFFVEAHTVGADDWTTLPDVNGHTSSDVGFACQFRDLRAEHPVLDHYLTPSGDTCIPSGATGTWSAASGRSGGYEHWTADLSRYAGKQVEISLTSATDRRGSLRGVVVDDVTVSTGVGSTSFEADGDPLDGWVAAPAPAGSPVNPNTWIAGTVADLPPTEAQDVAAAFARQPAIIRFLSGTFGPYPFSMAGGLVDAADTEFALETQTRPFYPSIIFTSAEDFGPQGSSIVAHELAHQWTGDSLTVARWQDIWLNEGFADYAMWLWDEHDGRATAQETFDQLYADLPADSDFWTLRLTGPGPEHLFDGPVYDRSAMTLHALRRTVGDKAFFRLVRVWTTTRAGGNVTTPQFEALAEKVSGRQLDDFFTTWLDTPAKPAEAGLTTKGVKEPRGQTADRARGDSPGAR